MQPISFKLRLNDTKFLRLPNLHHHHIKLLLTNVIALSILVSSCFFPQFLRFASDHPSTKNSVGFILLYSSFQSRRLCAWSEINRHIIATLTRNCLVNSIPRLLQVKECFNQYISCVKWAPLRLVLTCSANGGYETCIHAVLETARRGNIGRCGSRCENECWRNTSCVHGNEFLGQLNYYQALQKNCWMELVNEWKSRAVAVSGEPLMEQMVWQCANGPRVYTARAQSSWWTMSGAGYFCNDMKAFFDCIACSGDFM